MQTKPTVKTPPPPGSNRSMPPQQQSQQYHDQHQHEQHRHAADVSSSSDNVEAPSLATAAAAAAATASDENGCRDRDGPPRMMPSSVTSEESSGLGNDEPHPHVGLSLSDEPQKSPSPRDVARAADAATQVVRGLRPRRSPLLKAVPGAAVPGAASPTSPLEVRMLQLEQNLSAIAQFCQTLQLQQQRPQGGQSREECEVSRLYWARESECIARVISARSPGSLAT